MTKTAPALPTEPYLLAELIAAASVPETEVLYERLQAQVGDEAQADRIWTAALDEYQHGQAHDHAHEALRQGISAAEEAIRAALGHLGQLTGGDGYCVELADTTDGHDVAALLDQAGRLVRAAGKYLLAAESAETRPSTPFAPENILRGEDGRWYHDGVDVTDRVVGWKCTGCGHRYQMALGERMARAQNGCAECDDEAELVRIVREEAAEMARGDDQIGTPLAVAFATIEHDNGFYFDTTGLLYTDVEDTEVPLDVEEADEHLTELISRYGQLGAHAGIIVDLRTGQVSFHGYLDQETVRNHLATTDPPRLTWERADTDEPGDQSADSAIALPGCTSAYWSLGAPGPGSNGSWTVELIGVHHGEPVPTAGTDLGRFDSEAAAQGAAQTYERAGIASTTTSRES